MTSSVIDNYDTDTTLQCQEAKCPLHCSIDIMIADNSMHMQHDNCRLPGQTEAQGRAAPSGICLKAIKSFGAYSLSAANTSWSEILICIM